MGNNQYSRKWQRIRTYGGKLAENITQAIARDVLASSMPAAEKAGYQIVLSVHDELVCETPANDQYNVKTLNSILTTNPNWAVGLPLAAKGFECERYRKG
jgi:DNA polymerase